MLQTFIDVSIQQGGYLSSYKLVKEKLIFLFFNFHSLGPKRFKIASELGQQTELIGAFTGAFYV